MNQSAGNSIYAEYVDQFSTLIVTYFRNEIYANRIDLPYYLYIICRCKLYDTLCKTYPTTRYSFIQVLRKVSANTCQDKYKPAIEAAIQKNAKDDVATFAPYIPYHRSNNFVTSYYNPSETVPTYWTSYPGAAMVRSVDISFGTDLYGTSYNGYI